MNNRLLVVFIVITLLGFNISFPMTPPVSLEFNREHSQTPVFTNSRFSSVSSEFVTYLPIVQNSPCSSYVATYGNDANPGTVDTPWKTLQHAADSALVGSKVCIRTGTYYGFSLSRSNLSFTSYPGESVNVIGDGTHLNTIKIHDVSAAAISNLIIKNNFLQYGAGIYVENSSNVTISGNNLHDNQGFGVVTKNVSNVLVENNDASHNGNAIEVRYGSSGVNLMNNLIHQNDRTVDSGRGGIGITFYRTTGPVTAANNLIWENYTSGLNKDGVGFEVYAASNVIMTGNVLWDNQTILETGTDGAPCDQLTFTRNIAYRINWQQGLILRCASNSLIAQNTFDGLDTFVFDLSHFHGAYGGSIEGLTIVNNIAIHGRVYTIDTFPLPSSVVIDNNLVYNPPGSPAQYGDHLAYVEGFGNTDLLSEFQAWTGYEAHGVNQDPSLVNPAARDYHLQANSPAIDRGRVLGEAFYGDAPDIGRYEYVP